MNPKSKLFTHAAIAVVFAVSAAQSLALEVPSPNGTLTVTNDLGPVVVQQPTGDIVISGTSNVLSPFQIILDWNGASSGLGTGLGC
jgi:hypothetical protein